MADLRLWEQLATWKKDCRWIDLSHEMCPQTPHWEGFFPMKADTFMDLDSSIFKVHTYSFVGQYGTHVDVATHMCREGRTLEKITPVEMALPLCVIDKTAEVEANPDFTMKAEDIKNWEKTHGEIPPGAFVVFQSGWSKRPAGTLDNLDADGNRHYPGWDMSAVKYLIEKRNVAGIGHETSDTEAPVTSSDSNYAVEYYLLEQDRFQVELLKNVEQCPPTGALIFCTFPRVVGGTGFPARCFAVCPS